MRHTTSDPTIREQMLALHGTGWGPDRPRLCVRASQFPVKLRLASGSVVTRPANW
jgi:hypothetical protein